MKTSIHKFLWLSGYFSRNYFGQIITNKKTITFCTLTLSSHQLHSDQDIKKHCLNYFLTVLNKYIPDLLFIWKAEKQQNGNIHFHILFNKFIDHQRIRKIWNNAQNTIGYIDRYSEKFSAMSFSQYSSLFSVFDPIKKAKLFLGYQYGKQTSWKNPNSTDIHKTYNIKNAAAYLIKYMTKNDENSAICGFAWFASKEINSLKFQSDIAVDGINDELLYLENVAKPRIVVNDYFTVMVISVTILAKYKCPLLLSLFFSSFIKP